MMEPASPQSVRNISKTPSGSVLSNSSRPQAAGKFGIDLKTRTVALSPATFKETVQQLARLLGKKEDEEDEATVEVANEFLLCYKRFTSAASFFRRIKSECSSKTGSIDSVRGALRLLRMWASQYFSKDFWRTTADHKTPGRKRTRFASLISLLMNLARRRPEIRWDVNRVKLVILAKHKLACSPPHLLSELAVLKGQSSEKDKAIARFFDFPPRAVAEQLTLLEFNIFRQIEPEEFYDKGWTKEKRSPNLAMLVGRSDQVSYWVASNILAQKTAQTQARALNRFILIAQWCEQLGNYNSLMAILGGFHLWCISRLRKVFTSDKKYFILLSHLERIMSPATNYSSYRKVLMKRKEMLPSGIPTLPWIGLFLKDLTFIEDGNPDQFEDKNINVDKVAMIGYTLRIVRSLQGVDFNKKIKGKVTPLLKHLANIPRWSEEQLNQASESIKPRKAIDDVEQSGSAELSIPGTDESGSDHGIEEQTGTSGDDSDASDMVEITQSQDRVDPVSLGF